MQQALDRQPGVHPIDWSAPWHAAWATAGTQTERAVRDGQSMVAALPSLPPPYRFVPAAALPAGTAYEAHIHATGNIPTRDNAHDFFNGLAWHTYPRAKRQLNGLQAAEIARRGVGATRGPLRDAVTLFDESGAVLSAPRELHTALRAHDWHALFVTRRSLWAGARLWLVGHALAEKMLAPHAAITAHVLCAPAGLHDAAAVDGWLVDALAPHRLVPKPFTPLPVLGVPGWWAANAVPAFYDDVHVFRPKRTEI